VIRRGGVDPERRYRSDADTAGHCEQSPSTGLEHLEFSVTRQAQQVSLVADIRQQCVDIAVVVGKKVPVLLGFDQDGGAGLQDSGGFQGNRRFQLCALNRQGDRAPLKLRQTGDPGQQRHNQVGKGDPNQIRPFGDIMYTPGYRGASEKVGGETPIGRRELLAQPLL